MAASLAASSFADEPSKNKDQELAWARAQAAIAVVKSKQPSVVARTREVPYNDAVKVARTEHKPLLVCVGLRCDDVCRELRPAFVTCHETSFDGSSQPRLILLMHALDGTLYKMFSWDKAPTVPEIKAKAAECAQRVHGAVLDAAIASAICLESDPATPGYQSGTVCVGPNCPNRPTAQVPEPYRSAGYQWMPLGDGPVTAYAAHPMASRVKRRFCLFRRRVRCALGFEQTVEPELAATSQSPQAVGAGLIERAAIHRQLKVALRSAALTPAEKAIAENVLSDPDVYSACCVATHKALAKKVASQPTNVVGTLGDGHLLQLIVQNLPQLLAAFAEIWKLIHGG
jgi:hypothetical protein